MSGKLKDIIRLIRPHQWVKNGFVFVGIVFGRSFTDSDLVMQAIFAAIAFSLVSSGVYVLNDLRDIEQDRLHPRKRNRPLASGRMKPSFAFLVIVLMMGPGLTLAYLVSPLVLLLIGIYVMMNMGYSFGLKHVVILDVFIISFGFMLRILTGTLGIGIAPSHWLLFCGLMLTLFLGFSKRRAELYVQAEDKKDTRRVLEHYNPLLLDLFIGICLSCVVMSYSLYTVSSDTMTKHGTQYLIYTIPFVLYACFRYMYLLHMQGGGEDTARDLVRDPHIIVTVFLWGIATLILLFYHPFGEIL